MALSSFQIRKTDSVGSYVREEAGLDSALRSDDYVQPSDGVGVVELLVNPFNVFETVLNGLAKYETTIKLQWVLDEALQENPSSTAPVELCITVNQYGEPLTVEDGTIIAQYNFSNYEESIEHVSTLYKPGTWLYYGLFLKYSNGVSEWFERRALEYVQIPKYYESTDNLWSRVPEYYRALDYQIGSPLYSFLSLFGWELDRMRSLIDSIAIINDPLRATTPALDAIAKQLGVPTSSAEIGTTRLRSVLSNIFNLRQRKGTAHGTSAFIAALTGCNVDYDEVNDIFKVFTQRVNLVSDPKFKQQNVNYYTGTPSTVDRTPFTLRKSGGGSALRNPDDNDDAIRKYDANPTAASALAAYTTTVFVDTAASVGWGVYTYGAAFNAASVIPVIDTVHYNGENISIENVSVTTSDSNGIKITIPSNATGSQVVVVYGRKPFYYRNSVKYYTSFDCNLSGASFVNFRMITNDSIANYIEVDPADSLGELLYYDDWNTESAAVLNSFLYTKDSFYNTNDPGFATVGRFVLEHPKDFNLVEHEKAIVPALVFLANPGDSIVVSRWLVEPNTVQRYFDGDDIYGGFVKEANQFNAVGIYDYRWGSAGANQDFSYYTLDYDRIVTATERIVEEYLIPVNMIGQYTIQWDTIPGE